MQSLLKMKNETDEMRRLRQRKKNIVFLFGEKLNVAAYHEAGHAVVG